MWISLTELKCKAGISSESLHSTALRNSSGGPQGFVFTVVSCCFVHHITEIIISGLFHSDL